MFSKTLAALGLLLTGSLHAYDFQRLAEQHIRPVYAHLAEQTAALEQATHGYCRRPEPTSLALLRARYRHAFLAWQGAQHLRFGPVQYLTRQHRFALWPDKRGTVRKHLQRLREDPDLAQKNFDIAQKSVAVQGLSALERLLYDDAQPDTGDCRIITAIGTNLANMGRNLLADWFEGDEAYITYFAHPGADNGIFGSDDELAGQLLNGLHTELELIVTQKLARPLGSGPERARGKRAEGWRAGASLEAIAANLGACHALYRHIFAPELSDTPLHDRIEAAFDGAGQSLRAIDAPLSSAVGDPLRRDQVLQLQREISVLQQLVGRDMADALGLSLGFNSLDGD